MQSQKCQNICLQSMWISSTIFCSWRSLLVYKEHFSWGLLKKKEEVEDFLCLPRSREGAANLNWTQQTFHVCWGISLVQTNLSGLYLQTKEMTQSNFCTCFVSPTETSSISLPSKHLILLFPSGNWKNVNCLLLFYVNKFELVPTGRGLDRHNSYRTVWQQLPRFSGNSCFVQESCGLHYSQQDFKYWFTLLYSYQMFSGSYVLLVSTQHW